jgi:hypothetical protein
MQDKRNSPSGESKRGGEVIADEKPQSNDLVDQESSIEKRNLFII